MADVGKSKDSSSKPLSPNTSAEKRNDRITKKDTISAGKDKSVKINITIKGVEKQVPSAELRPLKSNTVPKSTKLTSESKEKEDKKKNSSSASQGHMPLLSRAKTHLGYVREPTFVVIASNGAALVDSCLNDLGWKKVENKQFENFKLKWVECKTSINYNSFKEGEQLVNRIPNCSLLTNKMGLLGSLRAYERVCGSMSMAPKLKLTDFIPETFKIDDQKEREALLETFKEGETWISKPTGMNQGKGIYLVRDMSALMKDMEQRDEKQKAHKRSMGRIIQRYIHNPLLLEGRKFDIRAYMLIASTNPFLVLYHKGYIRLSMVQYDHESSDLVAHLTNQYIQKRDPNYKDAKESTAWSMDKFNDYINEHVAEEKQLEKDWVYRTLTFKMKQIMTHCFHAVKHKLQCKTGYFDLYGLDFMVDESMKVWLIEVNVNPALAINCAALKEVIPGVVKETINVAIECFEKTRRNRPILPLSSLKNFTILHHAGSPGRSSSGSASPTRNVAQTSAERPFDAMTRSKSVSPLRRSRSLSPVKEAQNTEQLEPPKPMIRTSVSLPKVAPKEIQGDIKSSNTSNPYLAKQEAGVRKSRVELVQKSNKTDAPPNVSQAPESSPKSPNTETPNTSPKPKRAVFSPKITPEGSPKAPRKEEVLKSSKPNKTPVISPSDGSPKAPRPNKQTVTSPSESPRLSRATKVSVTSPPGTSRPPHLQLHPSLERSPYAMAVATADPIRLKMTHANSQSNSGKNTKKQSKERNSRGN